MGAHDAPSERLSNEDEWFRRVLDSHAQGFMIEGGAPKEIRLQEFFFNALNEGLPFWEDTSPTEEATPSPQVRNVPQAPPGEAPSGLPAVSSGVNAQDHSVRDSEPQGGGSGNQAGDGSRAERGRSREERVRSNRQEEGLVPSFRNQFRGLVRQERTVIDQVVVTQRCDRL